MDVVALHQSGFGNAVASLGTAFTPEQARLVKRYAQRAVLCYDNDEAGKKATIRAGDILFDEGVKVRVLTVTNGKDPDEFIKNKGADMFGVLIEKAKPLIEYKINEVREKYNLNDVDDKIDFTREAAVILARVKNQAQREIYVNKLSDELKISSGSIMANIAEFERNGEIARVRKQEADRMRGAARPRNGQNARASYWTERFLLNLMCDKKVVEQVIKNGITAEDFVSEPAHKRLAELLFELSSSGNIPEPADIISRCPPEDIGVVSDILINDKNTKDKLLACAQPIKVMVEAKEERQRQNAGGNDEQLRKLFAEKFNRKQ